MSKVIIFSRTFPSYHPKKNQPTYFVEKFWKSLWNQDKFYDVPNYADQLPTDYSDVKANIHQHEPKHHTIRAGHRFKAGDFFSPRVWSGKPYNSKQIIIAPDVEIKKVWDFEIIGTKEFNNRKVIINGVERFELRSLSSCELAKNDGLDRGDFEDWFCENPYFKKHQLFVGQIISWSEMINY